MNIIIISLERAENRRERIRAQLKDLNIEAYIMNAVDGKNLTEDEKNKKIHLPGGYRFGETFQPGEIGCTMSHINALKYAQEQKWPYLVVIEDDVYFAEDFVKRFNFLFKLVPNNWEHVYLSGVPRIGFNPPPNLQFCNVVPTIFTECTHSMLIRDIAYQKIIDKLSKFETTTDDIYNNMISTKQLISYTYYPFITYADDDYTYIWGHPLKREHKSKLYFKKHI